MDKGMASILMFVCEYSIYPYVDGRMVDDIKSEYMDVKFSPSIP